MALQIQTDFVPLFAAILGITVILCWNKKTSAGNPFKLPFPPGSKGLPIIGNVFDMPSSQEWQKATEWNDVYGTSTSGKRRCSVVPSKTSFRRTAPVGSPRPASTSLRYGCFASLAPPLCFVLAGLRLMSLPTLVHHSFSGAAPLNLRTPARPRPSMLNLSFATQHLI